METANGITSKLSVFCKAAQSPELVAWFFITKWIWNSGSQGFHDPNLDSLVGKKKKKSSGTLLNSKSGV